MKAQLGRPSMDLPIAYALAYPERLVDPELGGGPLDLADLNQLTFRPPDTERFPLLDLAYQAGRRGGSEPAVLCGADLAAVQLFLAGRIGFLDIARVVSEALATTGHTEDISLDEAQAWHQAGFEAAMHVGAALAS